jgi:hypothetical protein
MDTSTGTELKEDTATGPGVLQETTALPSTEQLTPRSSIPQGLGLYTSNDTLAVVFGSRVNVPPSGETDGAVRSDRSGPASDADRFADGVGGTDAVPDSIDATNTIVVTRMATTFGS